MSVSKRVNEAAARVLGEDSYFATCDRDEKGHCVSAGGGGGGGGESGSELTRRDPPSGSGEHAPSDAETAAAKRGSAVLPELIRKLDAMPEVNPHDDSDEAVGTRAYRDAFKLAVSAVRHAVSIGEDPVVHLSQIRQGANRSGDRVSKGAVRGIDAVLRAFKK